MWYKKSGCLHIKLTIPLLQLYKITNDETIIKLLLRILQILLFHFQQPNGSILLHKDDKVINLHTLCCMH